MTKTSQVAPHDLSDRNAKLREAKELLGRVRRDIEIAREYFEQAERSLSETAVS